jgi:outer membrane protein OmpA-like peptidoglycan-associated protein
MKTLIIPAIVFIGLSVNGIAQEKSNKEKRGDKYYFTYSFIKAIDCYTDAKHLSVDGQRKLAKSYQSENKDSLSEIAYAKLVNTSGGISPEDYYNYAMILKDNSKYAESARYMDKFIALKPTDLRAKDYIANKATLPALQKDDGKYKIENLNFNTDAEDFGTSYYKNEIVFTASRGGGKMIQKKSNWNGKPYLKMYVSEVEQGQMKTPSIFDKSLDYKMNDGPASFSKDAAYMAFTRNNGELKRKDLIVNVEIYFRTYKEGKWSKPEAFYLNNKDYSVGHPCLSANGNTMYFTSDMPGGYGGADIYRTTKNEKGEWSKPENLGTKINTEGDEMFPFYEENNGVLFFASNGRFGLGGLDIFICMVQGSRVGHVYNAGAPLNTAYDDFAMITDDKLSKGYFSSNRAGGSGDDDIYGIDILKGLNIGKQLKGIAKDKEGNQLAKTFITLRSDKDSVMDTLTTKNNGAYTFLVESNKNFKLSGTKEKYIEGDTIANTFGKEFIVRADVILLTREEYIEKKVEVGADLAKIVKLNQAVLNQPIYFDLDKYNLRPDAVTELNKIVQVMNEYPAMVVELRAYTDCRDTYEYNQILSDKRARVSAWYIKSRITKPERVYGKGYGETNLVNGCACEGDVVSTCSEEEHQKNRRTEFIIVKK